MRITHLEVVDFRNYERFEAETPQALTVFVGRNATGKTNLIEAIRLLTATVALRPCRWDELVRWGAQTARASLHAESGSRSLDIQMEVNAAGRRAWRVNGQPRRGAGDVAGLLPSVSFTPDDLSMIKGPAERRRVAADDLGAQISPVYASLRRDYGRAVRQRNALLREQSPAGELHPWDEQVASLGGRLLSHRLGLLGRVGPKAATTYADLAKGEQLTWRYDDRCGLGGSAAPGLEAQQAGEAIRGEIDRRREDERRRGTGLVGPHRDDIVFEIDGRDSRAFASQGQQRTIALAWKLAEVGAVEEVLRRRPVLLLDDVMSELDEARRDALAQQVSADVQTFVTTANLGYFSDALLGSARIVELEG